MEYRLVLVEQGHIVGRNESIIHAHSEASRVLDVTTPGVGKKGETVRVPHPLEDPLVEGRENPGRGVELALAYDFRNVDDHIETRIVQTFGPADLAADTVALAELRSRTLQLETLVSAQSATLTAMSQSLSALRTQLVDANGR